MLQIPISNVTPAPLIQGLGGDVVEPHGIIMLAIAFRVTKGFQTILVNFFIVGLLLPYDAINMSVAYQAAKVPVPLSKY
jgi:hypothetical protein